MVTVANACCYTELAVSSLVVAAANASSWVAIMPTHGWTARLSWPGWLGNQYQDGVQVSAQHGSWIRGWSLPACLQHRQPQTSLTCKSRSTARINMRKLHFWTRCSIYALQNILKCSTHSLSTFRCHLKHLFLILLAHWARSKVFTVNAVYKLLTYSLTDTRELSPFTVLTRLVDATNDVTTRLPRHQINTTNTATDWKWRVQFSRNTSVSEWRACVSWYHLIWYDMIWVEVTDIAYQFHVTGQSNPRTRLYKSVSPASCK